MAETKMTMDDIRKRITYHQEGEFLVPEIGLAKNEESEIELRKYGMMRKKYLENHELIRVATKYPNIAKDYFYNTRHQTVEIIKLNGSIELAPIVGLSEVIVDIVETGSTLKENGLVVLDEVCPLSARMIVNPVSMRLENDRIKELLYKLRSILKREA